MKGPCICGWVETRRNLEQHGGQLKHTVWPIAAFGLRLRACSSQYSAASIQKAPCNMADHMRDERQRRDNGQITYCIMSGTQ